MSLKKNIATFLASFFVLVLPLSSVFADSAGWQLLTWEKVHLNDTLDRYITGVNNAHASGNVKVCNHSTGRVYFYLKEYDPDNKDKSLTYAYLDADSCNYWNISGVVDGTNGEAEIYVQTSYKDSVFSIYD